MLQECIKNRVIVIVSDNRNIFDALAGNICSQFPDELMDVSFSDNDLCQIQFKSPTLFYSMSLISKQSVSERAMCKVDILINDIEMNNYFLIHKANTIINLSNNVLAGSIKLTKPFLLSYLFSLIEKNKRDSGIFCCINDSWIYNENKSCLYVADSVVSLTDKENKLFKKLLEQNNHKIEKEYLKQEVWNYHQGSESNTVDTHLYNLKQKLPDSLLQIKNSYCQLKVTNLS